VADFLRRFAFSVLLGDNDAHAKNIGILYLPGRSVLADVYDAVPNLFQHGRINYDLALAVDRSFDHRRISAAHLIRDCGPACLERGAPASGAGRSASGPAATGGDVADPALFLRPVDPLFDGKTRQGRRICPDRVASW
jgi:HipA-like C-terminal domain